MSGPPPLPTTPAPGPASVIIDDYTDKGGIFKGTVTMDGKTTQFTNAKVSPDGGVQSVDFSPITSGGKSKKSSRKTNHKRYLGKGKRGQSRRRRR